MLPPNPCLFHARPFPLLPLLPRTSIRCVAAAGDIPAGPIFPKWFQFPTTTTTASDIYGGGERIGQDNLEAPPGSRIKAKKWSRNRESYLTDDDDPLPLPMTYPDSSPVTLEEIDKRLRCDPEIQDCKEVVYEWTGECRSCQGTGLVSYYNKRGKEIICKCIPCLGIALHLESGFLFLAITYPAPENMSNVSFLEFQYKLSKNKFLRKSSRLFSRDRQSSGFSPAFQRDLNELKQVFDKYDSNKDGKISQAEYKALLRALGQGNMVRDAPEIFRMADFDGDAFINFKDFVEVNKTSGGVMAMDIQNAFRTFDLNCDGKISAEEVMEMLGRIGERCSLEECRKMVRAVDTDGDGMVDMDEFMTMMTRTMKHD
ncbi:hypothetical protein DITRI_Ditri01bG0062300 [Diplodiscus trichospermus]